MKTLSKLTQLNFIGDIFEPRYSTQSVIIAVYKIKRSKLDIKLRFSKVGITSEYAGDWFLSRKNALKYKTYNNNGLECVAIPWKAFEKLELVEDKNWY